MWALGSGQGPQTDYRVQMNPLEWALLGTNEPEKAHMNPQAARQRGQPGQPAGPPSQPNRTASPASQHSPAAQSASHARVWHADATKAVKAILSGAICRQGDIRLSPWPEMLQVCGVAFRLQR